jgi:hypothetical protein
MPEPRTTPGNLGLGLLRIATKALRLAGEVTVLDPLWIDRHVTIRTERAKVRSHAEPGPGAASPGEVNREPHER